MLSGQVGRVKVTRIVAMPAPVPKDISVGFDA